MRCLRLSLCAPLRSPLPACTHAHKGAKRGEGPPGPAPGISRRVNAGGSLRPRVPAPPQRAALAARARRSQTRCPAPEASPQVGGVAAPHRSARASAWEESPEPARVPRAAAEFLRVANFLPSHE